MVHSPPLHGVHHVILDGAYHVSRFWYYVVYTRAVQNNSGMSDEALLLTYLLGHVSGWFETKNSALEANQSTHPGGLLYKGGYKGKYQIYVKLRFETLDIIFNNL